MPWSVPQTPPSSLHQANFTPRVASVHPSPADWRDQILYFLLPDRFCDDLEGTRPKFPFKNPDSVGRMDKATWMKAGKLFQHGTLKGIRCKLPYLKELGVTALWIGPVFKQRKDLETYHGYGIQAQGGDVTIDSNFHALEDDLVVLYRDTWSESQLAGSPPGETVKVQKKNGRAFVRVDLQPAGMAILTKA